MFYIWDRVSYVTLQQKMIKSKTTPVHYVEHVDDWKIITPNCVNCNERE